MALSWNEIKDWALKFSKEWEGESRERLCSPLKLKLQKEFLWIRFTKIL
ncbi:hypothetical protein HQ585_16375 [candidate division KSB1 bacterium]|nr:hypothetical protein [candidate division KSB1 bacterium]